MILGNQKYESTIIVTTNTYSISINNLDIKLIIYKNILIILDTMIQ